MTTILNKLHSVPQDVQTATDYLPYAQPRVSNAVWQYLEAGAGKGRTMQANTAAFDAIKLTSRPLTDVRGGNTKFEIFGQVYEHPMLLAPIAYQRLFHTDGEQASAMAAIAQSGQMVVSSLASQTLEEIIEAANQPLWFQLYWQGDRPRTLRLLKRAITAGYSTVVFTVDAPVKQAVMALPAGISAVNLEPPSPNSLNMHQSKVFDGWMSHAPNWDDLAWLRDQTSLPLTIKGVMHIADAEKIIQLGCDGLVVSNHGGRVLDGVPSSLEVLPSFVERFSSQTKIIFDSGIQSGQDAYKTLALGADAVMIGRPYVWGLASAGALGVAHVIRLMRDELEMTMALTGTKVLSKIRLSQ